MIETFAGIIVALVIIMLSQVIPKPFTMKLFAATILVAIAFIYVGFSLKGNPVSLTILEVGAALGFYSLAVIGYTKNVVLIAYGIILHGLWDIFHHKGVPIQTDIPGYWPSFCFVVDLIDGLFFVFLFRAQKKQNQIDLDLTAKAFT